MAWYDIFRAKKEEAVEMISSNYDAFSTPFLKVGGANLSLPYVNGRYTTANQIRFGQDDMYPQLLNQMVYSSPLQKDFSNHNRTIDCTQPSVLPFVF
jgi:hypothetical protein